MKVKNKILKYAYILVIVVLVFSNSTLSIAATKDELNQRENELNQQIENKKSEIHAVEVQISETMTDIQDLTSKISAYEREIDDLTEQINDLNTEIEDNEVKLKEQEAKYEEQQDLLNKRLVALYEAGTTSYLDMLLSSKSLTQFISNYYLIETLVECDTNLLNSIEKLKNEIAETKAKLESDKEVIENNKETIEAKSSALDVMRKEKKSQVNKLNEDDKILQNELDEIEEECKKTQSELAAILAAEAASAAEDISSSPSSSGYISPLAGVTKNIATTYRGHTGIDFPVSSGTPIRAVKAGTVTTSTALFNSAGNYRSYGEYIIINHHDGTATLYAHGLPGSRKVEKGDSVAQGETIMQVGNTGNSFGAHLHFEVRLSTGWVNPMPYLP